MSGVGNCSQDFPFLPRLVFLSSSIWPILPVQGTCHYHRLVTTNDSVKRMAWWLEGSWGSVVEGEA